MQWARPSFAAWWARPSSTFNSDLTTNTAYRAKQQWRVYRRMLAPRLHPGWPPEFSIEIWEILCKIVGDTIQGKRDVAILTDNNSSLPCKRWPTPSKIVGRHTGLGGKSGDVDQSLHLGIAARLSAGLRVTDKYYGTFGGIDRAMRCRDILGERMI
jgi:hypothetical protein